LSYLIFAFNTLVATDTAFDLRTRINDIRF